jgi:hypothetical protein
LISATDFNRFRPSIPEDSDHFKSKPFRTTATLVHSPSKVALSVQPVGDAKLGDGAFNVIQGMIVYTFRMCSFMVPIARRCGLHRITETVSKRKTTKY